MNSTDARCESWPYGNPDDQPSLVSVLTIPGDYPLNVQFEGFSSYQRTLTENTSKDIIMHVSNISRRDAYRITHNQVIFSKYANKLFPEACRFVTLFHHKNLRRKPTKIEKLFVWLNQASPSINITHWC